MKVKEVGRVMQLPMFVLFLIRTLGNGGESSKTYRTISFAFWIW